MVPPRQPRRLDRSRSRPGRRAAPRERTVAAAGKRAGAGIRRAFEQILWSRPMSVDGGAPVKRTPVYTPLDWWRWEEKMSVELTRNFLLRCTVNLVRAADINATVPARELRHDRGGDHRGDTLEDPTRRAAPPPARAPAPRGQAEEDPSEWDGQSHVDALVVPDEANGLVARDRWSGDVGVHPPEIRHEALRPRLLPDVHGRLDAQQVAPLSPT